MDDTNPPHGVFEALTVEVGWLTTHVASGKEGRALLAAGMAGKRLKLLGTRMAELLRHRLAVDDLIVHTRSAGGSGGGYYSNGAVCVGIAVPPQDPQAAAVATAAAAAAAAQAKARAAPLVPLLLDSRACWCAALNKVQYRARMCFLRLEWSGHVTRVPCVDTW